jgi:hypothetical protein
LVQTLWPVTKFLDGTSTQFPRTRTERSLGSRVSACALVLLQLYACRYVRIVVAAAGTSMHRPVLFLTGLITGFGPLAT